MLTTGRALGDGVRDKLTPVLQDGRIVATLRSRGWRGPVAATVAERAWTFTRSGGDLVARWTDDAGAVARFRARQPHLGSATWAIELDGVPVAMELVSARTGTHRFLVEGRPVAATGADGWSSALSLTSEDGVPLEQQVFLLWVALVTRRRDSAAVGM